MKHAKHVKWISTILNLAIVMGFMGEVSMPGVAISATSPSAPTGLLTNQVVNPLAIDKTPAPVFTWQMNDPDRGEVQTAYQIIVASSQANIKKNVGDMWDSRKINSSKSASVKHNGSKLSSNTRYWWKVRVWDKDNLASPYSAAATFDVGLAKADWTASYIWDGTMAVNNFAYFRKVFNINKPVRMAKVYASAHNDYKLYLNGVELGRGPARSDPYNYGQYNAYDITSQLVLGNNAFAAMAHWHGVWSNSGVNASPAFILEARIRFTDGTAIRVKTDSTWKALFSTPFIESSPVYFGAYGGVNNRSAIKYDARQEVTLAEWMRVNFNDSSWARATLVDRSNYNMYAQLVPQVKEQQEIAPVNVTKNGANWIVRFDRAFNGWPKLTIRYNNSGDVVTVYYYQLKGTRGDAGWDQYICKGGMETWKPDFGRHTSIMTMKITGYKGTLSADDVRVVWAYTDAEKVGNFTSSSTLLNKIYEMSERSARQNVQQGIISVDANREQSPWTADSYLIGVGLLYNHRNTLILDKVVKDYAAEQRTSGNFLSCSPTQYPTEIPEWSMYWPMMLWQQYLFYGDDALLNEKYTNLKRFINWLNQFKQSTNLIDPPPWRISDYAGGSMESGGQNVATNAQYYENLRIASRIATILGKSSEAATYSNRAIEVKNTINTHLFTGHSYYSRVSSTQEHPLGSAWVLRFGILPKRNKAAVLNWIKTQEVNPGGYGGDAFYDGMYAAGGTGDFLLNDLNRYNLMLNGNKTNWESFGSEGEYNHAWTSYPAYLFQKHISGIRPTGGGFSMFKIKPEISGDTLTYAQSTVPTVKGNISTRWEKAVRQKFTLNVTVPANTKSKVYVPKWYFGNIQVKEGGTPIWNNETYLGGVTGIGYVGQDTLYVIFEVGSGSYVFEVTDSSKK